MGTNLVSATAGGVLLLVVAIYVSITYLFGPKYDAREPPVITHIIPYIGHILGLITYGNRYFEILSSKNKLPIYTLQTANKKAYIVNSADLVTAVERNQKTISFHPFVSAMSPRLFGIHPNSHTMKIINKNIDQKDGDWGLSLDTSRGMHTVMAPGTNLDLMVKNMLTLFTISFDTLVTNGKDGIEVNLFSWMRRHFSIASTEAIYGPANPFKKHADLEQAFWDFDSDFTMILLGIWPQVLARKGYNGRKKITEALTEYFNNGGIEGATGVAQVRYDVGRKYGATTEEIALFEIGDIIGILVNATPTLFWCILHFYSDTQLLADLRAEILASGCLSSGPTSNGQKKHTIDITTLQNSCPLLHSAYRELLRFRTRSSTSRWVTHDTTLTSGSSSYLVKANSVLLIPGASIHASPIWGPDAKTFQPRRFLSKNASTKAGAYRAWGGGQTLCPGRFFATTEILGSVAMIVMRFDTRPVKGGGEWVMPRANTGNVAASIQPPKEDVRVRMSEREGFGGDEWGFRFAEGLN